MGREPLGTGRGRLGLRGDPLGVPSAPVGAASEPPRVRGGPLEVFRRASRHSWMSSTSSPRTCRKRERHSPCAERTSRRSASACPPVDGTSPHGERTSRYSGEDLSEDRERFYEDGEDLSEGREDRSPLGGRPLSTPSGPVRMRRGPLGGARGSLPAPSGSPRRPSRPPALGGRPLPIPRRPLGVRRGHLALRRGTRRDSTWQLKDIRETHFVDRTRTPEIRYGRSQIFDSSVSAPCVTTESPGLSPCRTGSHRPSSASSTATGTRSKWCLASGPEPRSRKTTVWLPR
jgi:hypothetical protein